MKPQQETLTPFQQRVFTSILVLLTLAFSSVFAYAYWRGTQVRARMATQPPAQIEANRIKKFNIEEVKKKRVQIRRGASVKMTNNHFHERGNNSRFWTISKFPEQGRHEPLLSASVVSYVSSPGEWHISPRGVVTIPSNAQLGIYQVHYWARKRAYDYFFEVVPASSSRRSS